MSNGLELKAIIDSRIQEIKVNSHTFTKEPSKLHLKTKDVVKVQDVQSEQDNYELQYLSLKRKELQYQMLSQNADYEDDGEGLVDFSKKEITELPVGESEKWVEIVDEFGRNRLIRGIEFMFKLKRICRQEVYKKKKMFKYITILIKK
jgi:hypothetical protein